MPDYVGYILQGLFTGVGTAMGLWMHNKYSKPILDKSHKHIQYVRKIIRGGKR